MLNNNDKDNLMVEIGSNISLYPWDQTDELNSNISDSHSDSTGILIATDLDDWSDREDNIYSSYKDYEALGIEVTEQALNIVLDRLSGLESDSQLSSKLELAFGNSFNRATADRLIGDFAEDNFDSIPPIRLVSGDTLNSANGSYDTLNGLIYLSREFVAANQDNTELIADVILEEIAHHFDSQINQFDAPGDEGELFSSLLNNSLLSAADINHLKAEDDTSLIIINGQELTVENSLPSAAEVNLATLQQILPDSLGNIISQDLISVAENGATVISWSDAIKIESLIPGGDYLPELVLENLTLTIPATENPSSYELTAEATITGEVYTVQGSLKEAEAADSNQLVWDSLAIADLDFAIIESLLAAQVPDLKELIPEQLESLTLEIGENFLQVTYDGNTDLVSWIPDTAILAQIDNYLPDLSVDRPSIKITNNSDTAQYSLLGDITLGNDTVSLSGSFNDTTLELLTIASSDTNLAVDDWFNQIPLINNNFPTLDIDRPQLTIDGEGELTFNWHNTYEIDELFSDNLASFNLPSGFTDNFFSAIELSDHTLTLIEDGAGIQYSTQYNGDRLEVTYLDDEFIFNYEPTRNLTLGNWFQDIPLIEDITIADPEIFLGNAAFTDSETGLDLGEGFNIAGVLDLSNSDSHYLRWTSAVLGIDTLDIAIGYSSQGAISLTAQLDLDIPLFSSNDFSATLRDAQIDFSYDGSEPTFTIDGAVDVTVDGENLEFSGGFILEPESVTGFFALEADSDGWDNPFGLPDSEIRNLGFQIGGTYQLPSIDNIGFIGDLQFGNFDIETAVLGDINDPDNLALVATPNESLPLLDIALGPVASYALSQAADNLDFVQDFRNQLDNILDVQLEPYDSDGDGDLEPLIQIVPVAGVEIANIPLEEGIALNAAINAWGQTGSISLAGDRQNGLLSGSLSLDRIDLGNGVLVIEGFNDSQVNLDLLLSNTEQYLQGDVSVNFLGQQLAGINLAASQNGLEFEFSQNLDNFETNLQVTVDDHGFAAHGGLNTTLNLDIATALGTINLVDVGIDAQVSLALAEDGFSGSIDSSFDFYGNTFDLSLNVDTGSLDNLESLIFDAVEAQIQSSASNIFSTVEDWVSGMENGIVDFAGDAADFVTIATSELDVELDRLTDTLWDTDLVTDARQLADVLSDHTEATVDEIALTLQSELGFNTDTIADALSYGANIPVGTIATTLSSPTFVANPNELGNILQNSTSATTSQISDALSSIEASVNNSNVGNTVRNTTRNVGNTVSNAANDVSRTVGGFVGSLFG